MPLHSSHREAFLVSLIPRSRRAVWVVPQHGQSNTEVGRCHGCRVPAGQNRLGRGPSTRRIHGPRRLQLQVICRDNPAALEAQPHAVATVPDLLGGCSYPSPSSTCSVQVPEQSSSSRGREGGVGKGEAAPQGAPASSRECLRVSGAPTPLRGSSPHRRVPPAPRPRRPPASKGSDGAEPRGGGGGGPRAPSRSLEPSAPQCAVCSPPVPPGRVLTEAAVVVAGAVHRAVGEDLQVEAGAAVELAASQDPLQVGEVGGRAALQLPFDLAQALVQETWGVS